MNPPLPVTPLSIGLTLLALALLIVAGLVLGIILDKHRAKKQRRKGPRK